MDTSCPMTNAALWLALQICDSSFPGGKVLQIRIPVDVPFIVLTSGSFSHSNGLESAFHHGLISDEASLMKFIAMTVEQVKGGEIERQQCDENRFPIGHVSVISCDEKGA